MCKNNYCIFGNRAVELNKEGYTCAQSVVGSLCEEFGVDRVTALKISCAFGSGIGHSGETCGAITGAVMLIGLKYGKTSPGKPIDPNTMSPEVSKCYEMAQKFIKRFIEEYGAFKCRDLLGADTNTPAGQKYVEDNDIYNVKCNQILVRRGAELIAEILKSEDK